MYGNESIVLRRDVNAILIPEGIHTVLHEGERVSLYQSLGGSYTVITEGGNMVRISGVDADALGEQPVELENLASGTDPEAVEKNVWTVMKTIYDPEIPINIVDLGLVYHCKVAPVAEGQNQVDIIMTLTAPGCGMGPILQGDVELAVKNIPGVESVAVEVVFDPPWSRDMMSESAKLQLGLI